jgi:hypothetical protein
MAERYILLQANNIGWKKRHNISMRLGTNDSQIVPAYHDSVILTFHQRISDILSEQMIDRAALWNMDQTMVRFDMPARRTNNTIGETRIRIINTGAQKKGFTVALCASATGEKLPATIIFKEASGNLPLRVLNSLVVPRNVKIRANKSGWMDKAELDDWVTSTWGRSQTDARVLLLDQYRPHHMDSTLTLLSERSTIALGIPAGNPLI